MRERLELDAHTDIRIYCGPCGSKFKVCLHIGNSRPYLLLGWVPPNVPALIHINFTHKRKRLRVLMKLGKERVDKYRLASIV